VRFGRSFGVGLLAVFWSGPVCAGGVNGIVVVVATCMCNGSFDIGASFNPVRGNLPLIAVGEHCAAAAGAEYSDSLQAGYDTQGFRLILRLWNVRQVLCM